MCTLNTSEYDTFEVEEIPENISTSLSIHTKDSSNAMVCCKKCGCQEVEVSLKNKNKYCKVCFLNMLTHKFKATLGKSKLMSPNDCVLVAHSGKANSTVLLHLIAAGTNKAISKKLRFSYKVLYIDDGIVKGRTVEEREYIRNALAKEAESLQSTMYILSLSKCTTDITYEEVQRINVPLKNSTNEDAVMRETFDNLKSDTSRDELLQQLRRKLLVSTARKLNCNKVFVADTSVDLAIKVLGDVSTGRGSQLSFNVAFSDARHVDVTLLRPLKDFTTDDITGYLNSYKLYPILSSQSSSFSFPESIRNVTRSFIHKLDTEFNGTVSTICRTSEKLATKIAQSCNDTNSDTNSDANININNINCMLCELTSDSYYLSDEQELSVIETKLFSKFVSTVTNASLGITKNSLDVYKWSSTEQTESVEEALRWKRCECGKNACNSVLGQSAIGKYLCYSCRLIFLASKQVDNILPNFILNLIERKLQIASLQKEIADFLL